MTPSSSISPWISTARITILVASFFVALGSGTNYIYSAYSPQLGGRLNLSHTQLNTIGLAGSTGVFVSGPVWGRIVDSRGPRIVLIISCALLLGGYSGTKHLYDSGLAPDTSTLPALSFYILLLCKFVTGSGSLGGLTSSVNTTVKSFPDEVRGSTTGLVIAGFGLSAFFFITVSTTILKSNTSTFLLILALGTSSLMVLGVLFVRPIPMPEPSTPQSLEDGNDVREALLPTLQLHNHSCTALLSDNSMEDRHVRCTPIDINTDGQPSNSVGVMEVTRSIQASTPNTNTLNVHGKALLHNLNFWLLFSIYSLLAGTGVTYINNVGAMSQSLYAYNNPQYDETQALRWQAAQVSAISLTNFGGRILIGFFSDFTTRLYRTPRSHALVLVASLYLISQVIAANISNISNLWIASALLGLAHGSISALIPTVCLEWFGLPHFSENWGYLFMSPFFSINLLSFLFGQSLDAHDDKSVEDLLPPAFRTYSAPRCLQGRDCYVDAIYLTIGTTFLSFLLSLWAGYRDNWKAANRGDIAEGRYD